MRACREGQLKKKRRTKGRKLRRMVFIHSSDAKNRFKKVDEKKSFSKSVSMKRSKNITEGFIYHQNLHCMHLVEKKVFIN